ncbi:MAG: indolepyruvate ferredoxin oxidoreductase, alpha subunit [Methanohalophilus sp. T328-1]|jgi:indolepyruvate ferredoxin oxidoreductase alpha subunit|uniref:Indolepyruvate oxidoreductase subunit IorA n=1 Tax=Methanohalophilus euhalobius TaxID=51203 RepID=A0A285EQL4_9EURY|nr:MULTISPECIES: thiamine pyrophosphate-dependent enzyme [Methanohalophilus]KXS46956.1 MAG: indolepyruvate ferredoxin oxidoreductase, alpha subunit [Methanohalophilus sp. T328-1]RSD34655.1 MAG: indolepyruvate ferredoxin oxidoreductase, alpha subunit [Methanohalophilus sp.]OBZ36107.1 MAG: indolepyruvate ferredoxin oxidoreductase [Methanohalophilus sp. DAL1]ODV49582.1 MAG: indolepyruvate ferredoxin oxidoreductase, alpha subunit [Methanohalophilus sp. 2-GBenrich]RSD34888.1 MAG: indolepyruvate fer
MNERQISGKDVILKAAGLLEVKLVSAVAGYPVTSIVNLFRNDDFWADNTFWMINEKVALETALGASVAGRRSFVLTKHVGMNVLCDPLVTSATHTIGAGLVIIAGDDPGAKASQNEQDSRYFGPLAEVPVFDPATPEKLFDSLKEAIELSEKASIPVIVRVTSRLLESFCESALLRPKGSVPPEFDRSVWDYTMKGKHQRFHSMSYPLMGDYSQSQDCLCHIDTTKTGIISSGYPACLVEKFIEESNSRISHLALDMVYPLPIKKLKRFIDHHEYVLVVEETEDYIESHISIEDTIKGKSTGHIPHGKIEKEHILHALENIKKTHMDKVVNPETIKERGPRSICDTCPYLPLYKVLGTIDKPIAGDMGCSILSTSAPLQAVDTGFALGSAISVACGFKGKGIAVIGDFGLAHTGMQGLINAKSNGFDLLVIILQNDVAAMTGGQDVADLTHVLEALHDDIEVVDFAEKIKERELQALLMEKMEKKGISIILAKGTCPKY